MNQNLTILFDLDGTIINTAPDLMAAHNHVMRKFGFEEKKMEDIKSLAGKGAWVMMQRSFKEEIKPRYNYEIKNPNETEDLVNTFESGSIAMVKSGKKKSSSTEFFFVTSKIPELDGRYSIFGKIIKGLDVLKKINQEDYIKAVQISN